MLDPLNLSISQAWASLRPEGFTCISVNLYSGFPAISWDPKPKPSLFEDSTLGKLPSSSEIASPRASICYPYAPTQTQSKVAPHRSESLNSLEGLNGDYVAECYRIF